jgi:hypothetical protein
MSLHGYAARRKSAGGAGPSPVKGVASSASVAPYVQAALHKAVEYGGSDASPSPSPLKRAVAFIEVLVDVPKDFELQKRVFGPLAGVSREERIVAAYRSGALAKKAGAGAGGKEASSGGGVWPLPVCSACGEGGGHWRDSCPSFFFTSGSGGTKAM